MTSRLRVWTFTTWRVGFAASERKPLTKVPESWAVAGFKVLLIDHEGAMWLDTWSGETAGVSAPDGLDLAQILGGETIVAADDTQYIVGATRTTDGPTNQVLRVDPDETLHLLKLGTPRLGAAATIVNGQLLVVGGAASGEGAEISNAAGTGFTQLPFPADARWARRSLPQTPAPRC